MTRVAIIGGGLAGTACAYVLKRAGVEPVIYEAGDQLAGGASGNELGMINPRFSAERNAQSEFFTAAFSLAFNMFNTFETIGWEQCGALHLITDEKRKKRYPQTVKSWGWDMAHMRLVDVKEASQIAGVDLEHDALYLSESGYVSPRKLCTLLAEGIEVRTGQNITRLDALEEEFIILACGNAAKNFEETAFLPIKPVRGQITEVNETHHSKHMKCNIHYGGYMAKPVKTAKGGVHTVGATFQPWLDHSKILPEDNHANIEKIGTFIPALAGSYEVVGHRASVRATSQDHFPMVGQIPDHKHIYVSTAHGSHGIISSLKAAELLADVILERPRCLPTETIKALSPARFV